jgi:anti-anti-sigma factor
MTKSGKILYAEHDGAFILKLEGDVRLNLCTTLDSFINTMFTRPDFMSVLIDLSDAEGLDSTTLGLLAKLSIEAQQRFRFRPVIFCENSDIIRLLDSMGFSDVFDIQNQQIDAIPDLGELPLRTSSEELVKQKVIEAHRILAGLSADNKLKFKELLEALDPDAAGCKGC